MLIAALSASSSGPPNRPANRETPIIATILMATDGSEADGVATRLGLKIATATRDEVAFIPVWDVIPGVGTHISK